MSKKHIGSAIDDFLKKEGIFEAAQSQAIKELVAWQLAKRTVRDIKTRNAGASPDELQPIIDDAVREVRRVAKLRGRGRKHRS